MGYIFSPEDADVFDNSFNKSPRPVFAELQKRLMLDNMPPMRGKTVLDVGCGDGRGLASLLEMGLQVSGLEPSAELLKAARHTCRSKVTLHQGVAEDLPFDDNSYHYVCLVNTLEFVDNVPLALEEACRVAKNRLFIGFINRHSFTAGSLRVKGLLHHPLFKNATFFSIWELQQQIRTIAGDVPVNWGTASHLTPYLRYPFLLGKKSVLPYKSPFGLYAGLVSILTPRFRTTPLTLTYPEAPKQAREAFSGSCISREG